MNEIKGAQDGEVKDAYLYAILDGDVLSAEDFIYREQFLKRSEETNSK